MERVNLYKNPGREYVKGSRSAIVKSQIVNKFHKEVARQILLGNRVLLPNGMSIEIIKVLNKRKTKVPRFGFNYVVKFNFDKVIIKRVKFKASIGLEKKLEAVLLNTDFDYRLVDYGN